MLVHEIVTRAQNLIEDPDYWTSARLIAFINDCIDDLSLSFGVLATAYKTFNSVVGQQSYGLPYDFLALKMLYWGTSGNMLNTDNQVQVEDVYSITSNPSDQGTPDRWFIWAKSDIPELWVYPTFSTAEEVQMFYWRRPPQVVNNNDEPLVPRDWHRDIVQYCRRMTWVEDESHNYTPERFDMWWEMTKSKMQVAQNIQLAASDSITLGNFSDRMPGINNGLSADIHIRLGVGSDGVIW